jgi:phage-related minor tail protein
VSAGHPYLVGEEGPEIIIPGQSGMVHDAGATARMMSGSGGDGSSTGGGNHYDFDNHGVIGSQQQMETWLTAGIDSLRRKRRM